MVETIAPVVHGGRRTTYAMSVAAHVLGATVSAALLGLVLGSVGAVIGAPWGTPGIVALAVVALVYALREGLRLPVFVPDRHAQVPEWWRTFYSPTVSSFLYGLGLGVGFFTYLSFGTYVAVTVAALLSGHPFVGALLCGAFGLARGLSVLVATGGDGERVVARLDDIGAGPGPRLVNAAALVAVVMIALTTL